MQAGGAVDVVWALTHLESSQPAVLRGKCDVGFVFFQVSPAADVYLLRFSAFFLGKVIFLMRLICVFTSVTMCCSCLACVAYAWKANCEVL